MRRSFLGLTRQRHEGELMAAIISASRVSLSDEFVIKQSYEIPRSQYCIDAESELSL